MMLLNFIVHSHGIDRLKVGRLPVETGYKTGSGAVILVQSVIPVQGHSFDLFESVVAALREAGAGRSHLFERLRFLPAHFPCVC